MAHENKSMRLSGDVYMFRISNGVEQKGLGPLNADVLSFQSAAEVVKVADKRRGRRGQNMKVFTDPAAPTGSLNLYSVPAKILAMLMLGRVVDRADTGGTASGENVTLESDLWSPLAHANVSEVTLAGGVNATLATGTEGSNNAITWTARLAGTGGNATTVTLVNPGTNSAALGVVVTGTDIVVNLATSGAAAITSTAAQVMAAIAADEDASALVTVASTGASTGAAAVVAVTKTSLATGANTGGTTYVLGTDFEIDGPLGLLRPIEGRPLASVANAFAGYSYAGVTGSRIEVSTDYTVRARLLLRGVNDSDDSDIEWEAYSALLTPNGEFDLLSAEPVQAQFSLEFETPSGKTHPIRLDFPVYA